MPAADAEVKFAADLAEVRRSLDGLKGYIEGWGNKVKQIGIAAFAGWAASKAFNTIASTLSDAKSAIIGWMDAASEAEDVDVRLDLAVKQAGRSLGVTTEELKEQANALEDVSIFGDEAIKMAQTSIIRFNLYGDTLKRVTEASVQMAAVQKMDVTEAAQIVGRAIAYPERALMMLRRAQITLTTEQREHIQDLLKHGRTAEAQAAILDGIIGKYGDANAKITATYSGIHAQLRNLAGDIEEALGGPFLELAKQLLPTLRTLAKHIKQIAEEFNGWLSAIMQSDSAQGAIKTMNDLVLKLFSYIEAAVRRLPATLKWLFDYIKVQILDIQKMILSTVIAMPGGAKNKEANDALIKAIQDRGVAMAELRDSEKELAARGTFGEEADRVLADINKKPKKSTSTSFGVRPHEFFIQAQKSALDMMALSNPMIPQGVFSKGLISMGAGSDGLGGGFANMMSLAIAQSANTMMAVGDALKDVKTEQRKPFQSAIEDAGSVFRRIQTARASEGEEKVVDQQKQMLIEMKKDADQNKVRNELLQKILDKDSSVARAG